jgi:dTDP-4-dehydrorhamnose reductase
MKILIIGSKGQLGTDMVRVFNDAGHTVVGVDMPEIDITVSSTVASVVGKHAPSVILNLAAFTAVDDAEAKSELAFRINGEGPANVALAARDAGAALFQISTDYVFDGRKPTPYVETDAPNPQSVYGKSKLVGEQRVLEIWPNSFVWRIAWLYGAHGQNFVKTIVRVARQNAAAGKPLKVVNDQRGCPTHTIDVCRQLLAVLGSTDYGIYHGTSTGACTWFEFAKYFLEKYKVGCTVVPCTTAEFPRPAPRPANSVLENARLKSLGLNRMPDWHDAFDAFFADNPELP